MRLVLSAIGAIGLSLLYPGSVAACIIIGTQPDARQLTADADVIAVAVAREFVSNREAAGDAPLIIDPDGGRIRFEVLETLKGHVLPRQLPLMIRGAFTERDDFNDASVPMNAVRPEGRSGPCFASHYRRNASYLLLLKTTTAGTLTPYWSPLSRVNDQVVPGRDEWVEWVRVASRGSR